MDIKEKKDKTFLDRFVTGATGSGAIDFTDLWGDKKLEQDKWNYLQQHIAEQKEMADDLAARQAYLQGTNYEAPEYMGNIDYQGDVSQLNGTAFSNIQEDPRFKEYQMAALGEMADKTKTGMTATEAEIARQSEARAAQQRRAGSEAADQLMRRQGVGAGQALLAGQAGGVAGLGELEAGQSQRQVALSNAALEALRGQGSLATTVRGQEFGQLATVAGAEDEAERFNRKIQERNYDARQRLAELNMGRKEQAASGQVSAKNLSKESGLTAQQYNNALRQQGFGNRYNISGSSLNYGMGLYGSEQERKEREKDRIAQLAGKGTEAIGRVIPFV